MNIPQAQQEILRLWEAYQSGQLSAQAYTQAVNQLQIIDESGAYWHVDSATQKWYRYDGSAWVEQPLPVQAAPPFQRPSPVPLLSSPQPAQRTHRPLRLVLGVLALALLIGTGVLLSCTVQPGGQAAQLPTPTQPPTLQPTPQTTLPPLSTPAAPEPTATLPAIASATLPPRATAVPTQPPDVTPIAVADFLPPGGPYLLSRDLDNVYLIQDKRTDQINTERVVAPAALADMVAPKGGRLAFVTSNDPNGIHNLTLTIYNLAQKKVEKVIALTSDKTEPGSSAMPGDPAFEAVRSITESGASSLAWAPDGRSLAFIGILDGPSSDLYSYNVDSGKIAHLTDGPSQAYAPSWSPDGKYIVQFGVNGFGTGAGYSMAGAWAARADDSAVISLYKPTGGGESTLGWVDGNTVLVYGWSVVCGSSSLRLVTLDPLTVTTLVPGCFTGVAYDPLSHAIVLSIDEITSQGPGQEQKGLYRVSLDGKLTRLASGDFGETAALSQAGALWGYNPKGSSVAYTLADQALSLPTNVPKDMPLVSPDGKVWMWGLGKYDLKPGLWLGGPGLNEAALVFKGLVSAAAWTRNGAALAFVSGGTLYFAPSPSYAPASAGPTFPVSQLVWALP